MANDSVESSSMMLFLTRGTVPCGKNTTTIASEGNVRHTLTGPA